MYFILDNKSQNVQRLFDILMHEQVGDKQQIWQKLFPGEPLKDGRLRKLYFDLSALLEQYLAFQELGEVPYTRDILFVRHLLRTNFDQAKLEAIIKKKRADFLKLGHLDKHFFQAMFQMEATHQQVRALMKQPISPEQTQELIDLWTNYMGQEYLLLSLYKSSKASNGKPQQASSALLLQFIQQSMKDGKQSGQQEIANQHALTSIFLRIYSLYHGGEENEQALEQLIQDIKKSQALFSNIEEFRNPFYLLMNYLIRKRNQENAPVYTQSLFSMYSWAIEAGLMMQEPTIGETPFVNYVKLGISSGNISEVAFFVEKHAHRLPADRREEVQSLCQGMLAFANKDYTRALQRFNYGYTHQSYQITARFYQFQIFYERREPYHVLREYLKRLRRFLRQRTFRKPGLKKSLINRHNYSLKLLNANTKQEYAHILQELSQARDVNNPAWIIEKCEQHLARL